MCWQNKELREDIGNLGKSLTVTHLHLLLCLTSVADDPKNVQGSQRQGHR